MRKKTNLLIFFLSLILVGFVSYKYIGHKSWARVLSKLNKMPKNKQIKYTNKLEEDLNKTYRQEQKAIKEQWIKAANTLNIKPLAPSSRNARNDFYASENLKLNSNVKFADSQKSSNASVKISTQLQDLDIILKSVKNDPILSAENIRKYPRAFEIGYCFGRALLTHKYLLDKGYTQSNIVKIFALGQMKVGHNLWNFHVAVGVQSKEHGLIILDPLKEKPLDYNTWKSQTLRTDIKHPKHRLRFYVTDPRKFLPAFGEYHINQLNDPHLKPLFDELLEGI